MGGAERARGRVLARDDPDEPYSALDDEGAVVLDVEIEGLAGERTVVVATHDPERVRPHATAELALG